MTIYICGGSNSILKDGWTRVFSSAPIDVPVVNLSIGGTHSITALYRALFTADLKAGDVLLWEYCLNDINQLRRSPHGSEGLLSSLEILLTHCVQKGIRVAALLLTNRGEAKSGGEKRYRVELRKLLEAWQVPFAEPNSEYCEAVGIDALDKTFYRDLHHYAEDTPFMAFTAARGGALIGEARVPKPAQRRFAEPGRGVAFLDQWSGAGSSELTGTSLVRLTAWSPEPELRLQVPMDATLLSAVLFAASDGGGFECAIGQETVTISGEFRREAAEHRAGKIRLISVYLRKAGEELMQLRTGDELVLRRLPRGKADALKGYGQSETIKPRNTQGQGARMVGLLVEVDGGLGAG